MLSSKGFGLYERCSRPDTQALIKEMLTLFHSTEGPSITSHTVLYVTQTWKSAIMRRTLRCIEPK